MATSDSHFIVLELGTKVIVQSRFAEASVSEEVRLVKTAIKASHQHGIRDNNAASY